MKKLRSAYGAGFRAGKAPAVVIRHPDGTKTLGRPESPFKLKRHVILHWVWETGYCDGLMKSLQS